MRIMWARDVGTAHSLERQGDQLSPGSMYQQVRRLGGLGGVGEGLNVGLLHFTDAKLQEQTWAALASLRKQTQC